MDTYLNMKKALLTLKSWTTLLVCLMLLSLFSCQPSNKANSGVYVQDADYLQIVLFHLAQRCESCNAVEDETLLVLEKEYGDELRAGQVKFISLNYQSQKGKEAASLLKASGQTLMLVQGDSITDLTSAAFMFASTRPDTYRQALREALDNALE